MPTNASLPDLETIREELGDCDTTNDRLTYLIELGDTLDPFPQEACIETNRVLGCQSNVWVTSQFRDRKLFLHATSDAPMVKGLAAILVAAFSGKSPDAILAFPVQNYFRDIHLSTFLSPMRSNGLNSMVQRIQQLALEASSDSQTHLSNASATDHPATSSTPIATPSIPTPSRNIADCRADFPILARRLDDNNPLIYFDNAASTQRPQVVIDTYQQLYSHYYSNTHRSGHQLAHETTVAIESARHAAQRFINAPSSDEVIFTSGTTAAINMVARAWGDAHIQSGDEIWVSEMEHHSNIVPWQQLAQRSGAHLRWINLREDMQLDLDAWESQLSPRAKILAVTAVSNVLGTINPIARMAEAMHRQGGIVLVDAAQAVSLGRVDVQAMHADFLAFGGHKMLGPNGVGVLYGKRPLLESMPPLLGGGGMIDRVTHQGFTLAPIPFRHEAGTPPIAEIIALQPAIEYLESVGHEAILQHERHLLHHLLQAAAHIPELKIHGPALEFRTGIATFTHSRLDPDQIGKRLDAAGIAIRVGHHCAMPLHQRLGLNASCRASFHLYNTIEEVDKFLSVLRSL